MNDVDLRGERAGDALRRAAQVDAAERLVHLHRTRRHRTRRRAAALVLGTALVTTAVWGRALDRADETTGTEVARPAIHAALGPGATVVDVSRSPSGEVDAVVALRDGLPSVVAVVPVTTSQASVVWSAPTAQEADERNLPRAAAVAWAPDGSRLAILLATPRHGAGPADVGLTLVTVAPDGSGRELLGSVGRCECDQGALDLLWRSNDQVEVVIPDGPDEGIVTRRVQ